MKKIEHKTMDGNTACANIAYKVSEIAPIYPITPSSTMAELCDVWATEGVKNIYGKTMTVSEMQSEAGASGTLHGALRGGALATTFTASQGLLLMIPNMYKIAGELLPCVIHVSARALATHALSIFGDHSDVMATRSTGFAMLASSSVQEAQDMALVAHSATLKSSVPFLHFFDGFRTSHEVNEVDVLNDDDIKAMIDMEKVREFKNRALSNTQPRMYGTSQSADVYFANRESANRFYNDTAKIVEDTFAKLREISGREYHIFDYYGVDDAEYVVVCMGSGCAVLRETCEQLNKNGEKFGVLVVRLYRPFDMEYFVSKLPKSVKKIAVLDRTKENGAVGEPLFVDVCTSINQQRRNIEVIGGRYGLGSFEFNPAMVKAVYDNLKSENSINHFTVGINDDLTHTSLPIDTNFEICDENYKCVFFGIGGDGTISANKNSAKIIGQESGLFSQAYFVYDSKKSGSMTVSHLRFGQKPINEPYQIVNADFLAVHNFSFISKIDVLQYLKPNGIVLLNCPFEESQLDNVLSNEFVRGLKEKNAKLYIIDALKIAKELGLKNKINIIMQSAFFHLTNILPFENAKVAMAEYVKKSYSKFGQDIVNANITAISYGDKVMELDVNKLKGVAVTQKESGIDDEFYNNIMLPMSKLRGQEIKTSAFSADGNIPTGTAQFEKRGIATDLPKWHKENCIQCNLCSLVCPHAAIRAKLTNDDKGADNANSFMPKDKKFCIGVSPLDCTGCGNCANVCPARQKAITMEKTEDVLESTLENYAKFETITPIENTNRFTVKTSQFEKPLLEFSGACAGCGQTAYVKLLTQLCGESMLVANATGCSSIWGGSYPSCPYTKSTDGLGVAWANSLFEDNAEFGLGIRLATEIRRERLKEVWGKIAKENATFSNLYNKWLENYDNFDACKAIYFELLEALKTKHKCKNTKELISLIDVVMPKNVWIIGGDGWAYDIGYGGLDHVLASGANVNVLVLDTEVYSNTGGQASKATPLGAVAKFAQSGKKTPKKDLAKIAMQYDNVYVAKVCIGANPNQALTAFKEAMEYDGPSIIIAYAPCVAQGVDMTKTPSIEKMAVQSGYFTLLRRKPEPKKTTIEYAEERMKTKNAMQATSTTTIPNTDTNSKNADKSSQENANETNKQNTLNQNEPLTTNNTKNKENASENKENTIENDKNELGTNENLTLENYSNAVSGELIIDSGTPTLTLEDFLNIQNRFKNKK